MNVEVRPFSPADLIWIDVQPRHAGLIPFLFHRVGAGRLLQQANCYSFTVWSAYGQALACGGITNEGGVWAFLAADCRNAMVVITRVARRVLKLHLEVAGPVFADVDPGYRNAVRLAKALGFRQVSLHGWIFDGTSDRSS